MVTDWPAHALIHMYFFPQLAVRGVRSECFMKACFVHTAAVWDEFILEERMEERAKECSHIGEGERGEEGGRDVSMVG